MLFPNKRAFVTGGTGFLGSYLVRALLVRGWEVSTLVRTMNLARDLPRGARGVPGDITKPESLRAAMQGAEAVFHAAALYEIGTADAEHMRKINVDGTRAVLELAAELGVPKIVYTSTVGVYGMSREPVDESYRADGKLLASEYERTKFAAHYEVAVPLQQKGAPIVIVCPGMIYGPGDTALFGKVVRLYWRGLLPVMIGPDCKLTWAHAQDIAEGHWLAYEKGRVGETYNLAGPTHTFREYFETCQRLSGKRAPVIWIPGRWARGMATLFQPFKFSGLFATETILYAADISYPASAEKAKRELGWTPLSLEDGLREYLKWMSGWTGKEDLRGLSSDP